MSGNFFIFSFFLLSLTVLATGETQEPMSTSMQEATTKKEMHSMGPSSTMKDGMEKDESTTFGPTATSKRMPKMEGNLNDEDEHQGNKGMEPMGPVPTRRPIESSSMMPPTLHGAPNKPMQQDEKTKAMKNAAGGKSSHFELFCVSLLGLSALIFH